MELNEVLQKFGARLCAAMKAKGISQTRLSKLTKISNTHIKAMMNGQMNVCLESMRKLAAACEVDLKFFFDWE